MIIIFCSILGLIIGSFLNVVILRLPAGKKLSGRSGCANCHHQLTAKELVPVFSFLFLRGKCSHCKKKISSRYISIELATGLLFGLAAWVINPILLLDFLVLSRALFIIAVLILVFVIDFEHYIILDQIIIPGVAVALIFNLTGSWLSADYFFSSSGALVSGLLGAVVASLAFFAVWFFSRGRWMGFGDVKLALFLGMALGWPQVGTGVFLAFMLGGAFSIWLLSSGRKTMKSQIPFGTFLSLGAVLALFWGEELLRWYLALIGF